MTDGCFWKKRNDNKTQITGRLPAFKGKNILVLYSYVDTGQEMVKNDNCR